MTIRMDYAEVSFNGALCCLSFLAQDLLKSSMQNKLPTLWCASAAQPPPRFFFRAVPEG